MDEEIGPGLAAYLFLHRGGLKPVLCAGWEELHTEKAPLALIGERFWEEREAARAGEEGILLIRLGEGHICPYQPADCLLREVYAFAVEHRCYLPGAFHALYEREVVAVCSPHGYDLQTAFALVYGLMRAEKKRTLFLDFSYYSGFFDAGAQDVGDFIYEMHKGSVPMHTVLAALTQTLGRLDYIPPVHAQMDLEDLTGEDFTELLRRVLQESGYGLVVLNLPCRPSFLRAVYGCCNCMYSLQREGTLYDRAQARLLEDLGLESGQKELSNLKIVPMPAISGSFPVDASMYETLLLSEMAAFVRGIVGGEEA